MVRMRLQRHGRKKAPFYHIVVAHSTSPRDGKFIERLGHYNPTRVPAQITLDIDKALQWLHNGAEPSTTVKAILKYKGVLYKKHLMRGVKKGAMTMEVAEEKFAEWVKTHEGAVMDHVKSVEDNKLKAKAEEMVRIEAKRKTREEAAKKAIADAEKASEEVVAETEAAVEETVSEATAETSAEEPSNEQ
ncbi:MAG: 30S ribosomal protein S16 [Chitinophagales bacterium]